MVMENVAKRKKDIVEINRLLWTENLRTLEILVAHVFTPV